MKIYSKILNSAPSRERLFANTMVSAVCLSTLMMMGSASAMNQHDSEKMASDCGQTQYGDPMSKPDAKPDAKPVAKDIIDTAVGAGGFSTLVVAVQEAGLVEILKGEGPFTVFAPTDEAFAKIPADQLQALLADKDALTSVLTYHVVPGKVLAEDVVTLETATTVQGSDILIDTSNGVRIDQANVVMTDIVASNGVIHVIDAVIMPN